MAISDENTGRTEDIRESARGLLEEASKHIIEEEYEKAYDILSTEMEETVTTVRRESYRDERVVANRLEREVIENLNSVVTGESYPEKSLEDAESELKAYFSERSWKN